MMDEPADEHPRKRARLDDAGSHPQTVANLPDRSAITLEQQNQELKFGISAFVSEATGFSCVVKQRYTDFLVNEIDKDGKIIRLERQHSSEPIKSKPLADVTETNQAETKLEEHTEPPALPSAQPPVKDSAPRILTDDERGSLDDIFGANITEDLILLNEAVLKHPGRKPRDQPQSVSGVIDDKQKRTDAHVAVRKIFDGRIETSTLDDNRIEIKAAPKANRNPRRTAKNGDGPITKGKVGWDELGGEFLHFTLCKENKDTMEVLFFIASQLKVHVKNFQFAGTKDRRGVTVQRVSAYRILKERLQGLNKRLRQAYVGGFEYKPHGLELGDLSGNQFTIALRDIHLTRTGEKPDVDTALLTAIKSFKDQGFLNYYGLQRFGSFNVSTDDIGRRMLKGDLKGAVDGILTFPTHFLGQNINEESRMAADDIARAQAIDAWNKTGKSGAAVEKLPRRFQAENAVIRHLGMTEKRSGRQLQREDYQGALMQIPRNLRLMYVHAYQSLIWNKVITQRFELFGLSVVEGDLVIVESNAGKSKTEEIDESGEVVVHPAGEDSATATVDKFERARPLSKDEAASGQYTVFDIVLPLPGFDIVYPPNSLGKYYEELMAKDELDPRSMRRSWKDISLSGSYRKVMAKPLNVAYNVVQYSTDEEQLTQTDLDRMNGAAGVSTSVNGPDGDKRALVLTMQLGSSQYATMALRELTKGGAFAYKPDFSGR